MYNIAGKSVCCYAVVTFYGALASTGTPHNVGLNAAAARESHELGGAEQLLGDIVTSRPDLTVVCVMPLPCWQQKVCCLLFPPAMSQLGVSADTPRYVHHIH
jgi:hypothetical protein